MRGDGGTPLGYLAYTRLFEQVGCRSPRLLIHIRLTRPTSILGNYSSKSFILQPEPSVSGGGGEKFLQLRRWQEFLLVEYLAHHEADYPAYSENVYTLSVFELHEQKPFG